MEPSLWNYLTPNSVFEPIRVMVSNRLATDGNSWSTIFSMFNSGTYVIALVILISLILHSDTIING